ncbi:DUF3558 domain-containing protein [Amycolatopsis ultiminotia]|uniref:DUF3558 domain-containing protein n=1 Tax=Amycolatopsis ultiminotia TaxID=543629 RepID=A0ABP6YNW2_9PSEU
MNLRAPLALLGAALLLAACSSTTAGTPSPAPSSSTAPASRVPPYAGAPKVENPLPDSVLAGDPCQALTQEQIVSDVGPGITGKQESASGFGPTCDWPDSDAGSLLTVSFMTGQKLGLSALYDQTRKLMKRFDVLPPVQGYPAVAYDDHPGPQSPSCQTAVGISDTLRFEIGVELGAANRDKTDACRITTAVAGQVLTTLMQKAGR